MSVYLVVDHDVSDWDTYKEYLRLAVPLIEKSGGRYLVQGGGDITSIRGDWDLHRFAIIEFSSEEQVLAFANSEEYAPINAIRHRSAGARSFIAAGV